MKEQLYICPHADTCGEFENGFKHPHCTPHARNIGCRKGTCGAGRLTTACVPLPPLRTSRMWPNVMPRVFFDKLGERYVNIYYAAKIGGVEFAKNSEQSIRSLLKQILHQADYYEKTAICDEIHRLTEELSACLHKIGVL